MTPPARFVAVLVLIGPGAFAPLTAQEPTKPPTQPPPPFTTIVAPQLDSGPKALLKIETDLACTVTVGLEVPRLVQPGTVLEIEVTPGFIEVRANAVATWEATVVQTFTLAENDRQRVKLKMVKALQDLRKLEARERTYRDVNSRLMWPNVDNGADVSWSAAASFCEHFEHGGWRDWRLPTVDELDSLQSMWSQRAFKTADPITLSSCCPWSSEQIDDQRAWNFNYRFRRSFEGHVNYSYDLRALCVRDGSDEIPENTRKNRREAKRLAKERQREKSQAEAATDGG